MNKEWNVSDLAPSPSWMLQVFSVKNNFVDVTPPIQPRVSWLESEWAMYNYCNPPYSNKIPWIKKAIEEMNKGKFTIMLLPQDTSAAWYHDLIVPNAEIVSFRGRLELDNGKHPRYGSMIVIFHPTVDIK